MSNGHRLMIEFKSLAHNGPGTSGNVPPRPHNKPNSASSFHSTNHQDRSRTTQHQNREVDEEEDYDESEEEKDNGDAIPVKKFNFGPTARPNRNGLANTTTRRRAKGFKAMYRFVTSK